MLNDLEVVIMARLRGDSGQAAVLDPNQIKRLLKIAQTTSHGQRDQTIITLSYWLGLRAKELASLKVGDVYAPDGSVKQILHLKAGYTKRGRIRDVYLSSDKIQKRLKEYHAHCASDLSMPLFRTRSNKGFSANGMVILLRHLHHLAGIEGGSSHSGRRTMITRLAEAGVDLKSIATLAGHSSIRTTAGYVENNPERLSKIMGSVDLV
jgi:integrase/recombinase XerD